MDLKSVKVDSDRGERGDWVSDIPGMGDLRLHVRGYANSGYQAFLAKEYSKVTREQRVGGLPTAPLLPHVRDAITTRGTVEHILLGWENLSEGGDPVPYSKEQAMHYLAEADYRVFADAVAWAAGIVDQIRHEEVQGATGN